MTTTRHMIKFEVDGKGYVIDSAELAGVSTRCPMVELPGLPKGVRALTQWSGRVYPVLDRFVSKSKNLEACTVLFSVSAFSSVYKEVALAVPSSVHVFVAQKDLGNGQVMSVSGEVAEFLSLKQMIERKQNAA